MPVICSHSVQPLLPAEERKVGEAKNMKPKKKTILFILHIQLLFGLDQRKGPLAIFLSKTLPSINLLKLSVMDVRTVEKNKSGAI